MRVFSSLLITFIIIYDVKGMPSKYLLVKLNDKSDTNALPKGDILLPLLLH